MTNMVQVLGQLGLGCLETSEEAKQQSLTQLEQNFFMANLMFFSVSVCRQMCFVLFQRPIKLGFASIDSFAISRFSSNGGERCRSPYLSFVPGS